MKADKTRETSLQIADWWETLLWPRILRSATLGVRPGRVGIALFGMVVALGILWFGVRVDGWIGFGKGPLPWENWPAGRGLHLLIWRWLIEIPVGFLKVWPATTVLFVVVVWPVWLVSLGAISRISAVEFCRGEYMSWTEGLSFSLRAWKSMIGAMIGPFLLVWAIAIIVAAIGFLFVRWQGLNVVGGVLYGISLLLGIVAALIGFAYALGHNLLVPAVMCEGVDAIDAIQRAYAYTLDRPVRMALYLLLAILSLAVTLAIIALILGTGVGFAYKATGMWTGESTRQVLWNATFSAVPFTGWKPPEQPPTGTTAAASWLIRLWTMIPVYAMFAFYVSCGMSCTTVVYLCMRRLCDGQDVAELWMPGMIEGVMDEAMAGRAKASGVDATSAGSLEVTPQEDA